MTNSNYQGWVDFYQNMAANKGVYKPPEGEAAPALATAGAKAPAPLATVTLKAEPFKNFQPARGVIYCSDSTGLIHDVLPEHVDGLISAGAWPPQTPQEP